MLLAVEEGKTQCERLVIAAEALLAVVIGKAVSVHRLGNRPGSLGRVGVGAADENRESVGMFTLVLWLAVRCEGSSWWCHMCVEPTPGFDETCASQQKGDTKIDSAAKKEVGLLGNGLLWNTGLA